MNGEPLPANKSERDARKLFPGVPSAELLPWEYTAFLVPARTSPADSPYLQTRRPKLSESTSARPSWQTHSMPPDGSGCVPIEHDQTQRASSVAT
jgi:hypothetical protein